jgi:hypothetical protein
METKEHEVAERLEAATTLLERTVAWLEERQTALCGQVERISATVEQTRREEELEQKLAAAERDIAELKAAAELAAAEQAKPAVPVLNPVRRTVPAAATEMLAKHGIGEGPVDVKTVDAALIGLSLEQRIAVKSQLLKAGAIG